MLSAFLSTLTLGGSLSCLADTGARSLGKQDSSLKEKQHEIAGIVIEAVGKWQVLTGKGKAKAIIAGDPIPYGGALRSFSRDARLSARLINGERLHYPGNYHLGKALRPLEPKGDRRPWWVIALDLITAPNGEHIAPIVRGENPISVSESVVELAGESIRLANISWGSDNVNNESRVLIRQIDPFSYRPIEGREWGPLLLDASGATRLAKVTPGLYDVAIQAGNDDSANSAERFWILIAEERSGENASARFRNAKQSLAGWSGLSARAKQRLLRAVLVSMAREIKTARNGVELCP